MIKKNYYLEQNYFTFFKNHSLVQSPRLPRVFMLSTDPEFPVLCREAPIPANLTEFTEDEDLEPINSKYSIRFKLNM